MREPTPGTGRCTNWFSQATVMRTWLKNPTVLCTVIGGIASLVHVSILLLLFYDLVPLPLPSATQPFGYALAGLSSPMVVAGPSVGCLFATLVLQWKS